MKSLYRRIEKWVGSNPVARRVAWAVVIALCCFLLIELRWAYSVTRQYYLLRQVVHSQEVGNYEDELRQTEQLANEFPTREYRMLLAKSLSVEAHSLFESGSTEDAFAVFDRAVALSGMDNPPTYMSYCLLLTKDGRPEAAEFMLSRAAYWQDQKPGRWLPETAGLVYRCDGVPYFEVANAALRQGKWNLAARVLVQWNNVYQKDWKSLSVDARKAILQSQLDVDLNEDELNRLSREAESLM